VSLIDSAEVLPDSILVAPGEYDEEVRVSSLGVQDVIVVLKSMEGPSATTVRRFCQFDCAPLGDNDLQAAPTRPHAAGTGGLIDGWTISGFTVQDSM
jgi:hypothetical protein